MKINKFKNKKLINAFIIFLLFNFLLFNFYKGLGATSSLAQKLKGKILLQVESNGEAWYINPNDLERYYLGKPENAFELMSNLGIGITNEDLSKIAFGKMTYPQETNEDTDNDGLSNAIETSLETNIFQKDSDNDGYTDYEEIVNNYNPLNKNKLKIDKNLSQKLAGNIVLQIENNGEAWYINPSDLKKYFLGKPQDAFEIMKTLALGIKTSDLEKIIEHKQINKNIAYQYTTDLNNSTKKYTDPKNEYSFEYPNSWKIDKQYNLEKVVYLTDSQKDYFNENKAIILITFQEDKNFSFNNFKIAFNNIKDFNEKIINEKKSLELILNQEYTEEKNTIIKNDDNSFVQVSLITKKNNNSYNFIYNNLLNSFKFLNNINEK